LSKLAADIAVNPTTYLVAIGLLVYLVNAFAIGDAVLVLLAIFPVAGLTLLSKSDAGQAVARKLEAQLPGAHCRLVSYHPEAESLLCVESITR
jgi:hypothetical protein